MPNTPKGPSSHRGVWATIGTLALLLLLAWAQGAFERKASTAPADGPSGASRPPAREGTPSRGGYAPTSGAPADAIPGGSLRAHEDVEGGHTLKRHVGLSTADLRRHLDADAKRVVSTFPDLAAADRAVGEVLYRRRAEIASWLAGRPDGTEAFRATLSQPVGRVLRRDRSEPVGAKSVVVVIAPSRRFAEGFHIVTAYVSLP